MVSESNNGMLNTSRLLVVTFLLPNTISFQVPREKDSRFKGFISSIQSRDGSRYPSTTRVTSAPVSVPPPTSTALYSPALEALHGSAPMPPPSSKRNSGGTSIGVGISSSGSGTAVIGGLGIPRLAEHIVASNSLATSTELFRDGTATDKTDRPKDQDRSVHVVQQQRSATFSPLSILPQLPERQEDLFPAATPRPALNQPRSRSRSTRMDDIHDSRHHHHHDGHPSSLDTQLDPSSSLSQSSPSSSPSETSVTFSKPSRQTPSHLQRSHFLDSAKVFADAKWTVEPAYSGNIGLHNAVNSIQDQLSKRIWIGTLGMATDSLTDRTRGDIRTELALNHNSIPVFVHDQDFEGHYHHFCKQVLWPIFHYVLPDNLRSKGYEDGYWKHYVAVNRAFADTIIENYNQGDTIWVNDYHLMLVPNMIRERLPDASIGFFLHIPFPSSEIFRCLHARKEVLEGLLGADLVGFQTYSFARHFLQTCSRLLSVETNPKGIQLENTTVNVGIFPIGIDTKTLNIKRQDPEVASWVERLKEKYAGMKLIVARDKLDYIKGVRQKMLAFERFLNLYPEYQGKIVLIQVALSTSEQNEVQGQVSDVVTRINSKFSDLSYQPIVFLRQDITFSQYLALLTVADLCLITPLRDGMNLTSHEYVVCQEERKNPLVLSEFAGTYGSLGACLRVNPWNYTEVAIAIHDALEMQEEEKIIRWNELRKHVCTNTAQFWAQGFVSELIKVHSDVQQKYSIHIPLLDMAIILPQYRAAKRRLQVLLLDYDGTLLPYERSSTARSKGKVTSNEEMIKVVTKLAQDPKNTVYVMSGRTKNSLEQIFESIPNIGLCAEGGCFLKHAGKSTWEDQVQQGNDVQWRGKVMEMFEYYKERTPGSEIEEKSVPIVWHYRQADNPSYGLWQARECQNHIEEAIGSIYPVHAIVGRKCLEVMPRNVSKASATRAIVESLGLAPTSPSASSSPTSTPPSSLAPKETSPSLSLSELTISALSIKADATTTNRPIDFILCMGDDRSDEDMFQFVNGLRLEGEDCNEWQQQEQQKNHLHQQNRHRIVTCTVGSKSSEARWFVPGVTSVLQGLSLMATSVSSEEVVHDGLQTVPVSQIALHTATILPEVTPMAIVD
ncbi:glycosyltransferase family 20-domain-containing protein [Lobosporangium transversale]|uniref:Glycosyltransferase family 20-domain-containing protein n=1 Tax=Lobosporangium transversale TaxID=64571 RepID=A0A1Y2GB93_9FUNG|nr:glycosyltransferase family 20-domain-containing protein [Lobosporangium transversale]ORZ06105.1 glycosyltransferase family 20-domain-containing protein [Lobosporangium transversale]|eukprot:XP_021877374.1 glycosyltransferase family 20-domain-containing protein [Lobosporangium transversale]